MDQLLYTYTSSRLLSKIPIIARLDSSACDYSSLLHLRILQGADLMTGCTFSP